MAKVNEDEQYKIFLQEQARIAKGEKECPNCGSLYTPQPNDGATCNNCWEYAMNKD
jgi:uncharacterized OB-fold protein